MAGADGDSVLTGEELVNTLCMEQSLINFSIRGNVMKAIPNTGNSTKSASGKCDKTEDVWQWLFNQKRAR